MSGKNGVSFTSRTGMDVISQFLDDAAKEDIAVEKAASQRINNRDFASEHFRSVQALARQSKIPYPPTTGQRVAFVRSVEAVFAYEAPPAPGQSGTIVTVKTSSGVSNHHDGKVFVRWDNGGLLPVHTEHLVAGSGGARVADAVSRRVAGYGDLTEFLKLGSDTLVHKATKDLWTMRRSGDDFVIERLFDETGEPLKV